MAKGGFGYNAKISAPGFGSRRVRCDEIRWGIGIIASSDNEARSRRAFYSIVTVGSSYTATFAFRDWEEREAFTQWVSRFIRQVSSGRAEGGYMTFQCPSRNFYRTAVPDDVIEFGEGVNDMTYRVAMSFVGARDPLDLNLGKKMAGVSYFDGPKKNATSRYFYPAGRQVAGAESLDGTIFDPLDVSGGTFVEPNDTDPRDVNDEGFGPQETP